MQDSAEPGHVKPNPQDKGNYVNDKPAVSAEDEEMKPNLYNKGDYVDEKPATYVEEEEIEPVVTPKTWVVVGVRYLTSPNKLPALTSPL